MEARSPTRAHVCPIFLNVATRIVVLVILLIIVLATVGIFIHHERHAARQRATIQSEIDRLKPAAIAMDHLLESAGVAERRAAQARAEANRAGQRRHELGTSSSPDVDTARRLAATELSEVELLQKLESDIDGYDTQVIEQCKVAFSPDQSAALISLNSSREAAIAHWLDNWFEAARDASDDLKAISNGEDPPINGGDIEQRYQDSLAAGMHADALSRQLDQGFDDLRDELKDIIDALERQRTALR